MRTSTTAALPTATYFVRTYNTIGYVDQLYSGIICPGGSCTVTAGTPITVTAGATRTGIDFTLAPGGTITGTVTAASGGAPLSNVSVGVYNNAGTWLATAYTNASGQYTLRGLPSGTYYLRTNYNFGYLSQVYSGINCGTSCPAVTTGTAVTVTAGVTTPGIDFALAATGVIAGTVASSGGAPLSGVSVYVYTSTGSTVSSATTNSSGVYATSFALSTGTYYARTSNSLGYVDQLYNGIACPGGSCTVTTGTAISVTTGATTSGIAFSLVAGATITGTVRAAGTGTTLAGVSITAYNAAGSSVGSASANVSGVYTLTGLPAGTYYLRTGSVAGYFRQIYNGIDCGTSCPSATTGTGVPVAAGGTASGIDFALTAGGVITGTVTAAGGTPLAGVSVYVYTSSGSSYDTSTTNASGVFTSGTALPTGTYYVRTGNTAGYVDQLYLGAPVSRRRVHGHERNGGQRDRGSHEVRHRLRARDRRRHHRHGHRGRQRDTAGRRSCVCLHLVGPERRVHDHQRLRRVRDRDGASRRHVLREDVELGRLHRPGVQRPALPERHLHGHLRHAHYGGSGRHDRGNQLLAGALGQPERDSHGGGLGPADSKRVRVRLQQQRQLDGKWLHRQRRVVPGDRPARRDVLRQDQREQHLRQPDLQRHLLRHLVSIDSRRHARHGDGGSQHAGSELRPRGRRRDHRHGDGRRRRGPAGRRSRLSL